MRRGCRRRARRRDTHGCAWPWARPAPCRVCTTPARSAPSARAPAPAGRRSSRRHGTDAVRTRVAGPSDDADRAALRAGLRISLVSIIWTVATSSAAVAIGIATNSLVVIAFGLTGLLDAAASVTLAMHFRHALKHEMASDRHERLALRLVTIGLLSVGLAT